MKRYNERDVKPPFGLELHCRPGRSPHSCVDLFHIFNPTFHGLYPCNQMSVIKNFLDFIEQGERILFVITHSEAARRKSTVCLVEILNRTLDFHTLVVNRAFDGFRHINVSLG